MRVALVHDWLVGYRGGEKLLEAIVELYPDADLYTLFHAPGTTSPRIDRMRIHASALSRLPGAARHYRKLLPLLPAAIERFHLQGYDLVISTSHSFAKGVRVAAGTPHLCVSMTPIRYVWDQIDLYLGRGPKRLLAAPLVAYLRQWDRRTSTPERITRFVAISQTVARRIAHIYGRESRVVHPPVDVDRFRPATTAPEDFFLLVGAFVPYKQEALAIEAFRRLDSPLVVAGDGPLRRKLQTNAPANVRFLGRVSDEDLVSLYARCRALVYPQEEDFGIIAVEAQACGRPVIAFGRGGAAETVVAAETASGESPTGVAFHEPTPESLVDAVRRFEKDEAHFDPHAIRRHAERFSPERFRHEIREAIEEVLA